MPLYTCTLLRLWLLLCALLLVLPAQAQRIMLQLPVPGEDGRASVRLEADMPAAFRGNVHIICRQVRRTDSVVVYDLLFPEISLPAGASSRTLLFRNAAAGTGNPVTFSFQRALERLGAMPAGVYLTSLTLQSTDSILLQQQLYHEADSVLTIRSGLKDKLDAIAGNGRQLNAGELLSAGRRQQSHLSKDELSKTSGRMSRRLGRSSGIDMRPVMIAGKSYTELYSEGWYLGRYELLDTRSMQSRITQEAAMLKDNTASLVTSNLEDLQSISGQLRDLYRKSQDKDGDLKGRLELNEYLGNGQEPGAAQNNNYTELYGDIDTKIFDMPVGIAGFYTTQDRHRQAKASYIRLHYDVEAAKSQLLKQVNTYKSKFGEVVAKGKGLEQVYGTYMSSLDNEKNDLLRDLSAQYGISGQTLQQYNGDIDKIVSSENAIDTTKIVGAAGKMAGKQTDSTVAGDKLQKARNAIGKDREQIKKQYDRLVKIQQLYMKYMTLLNQYKEQLHMDSALVYNKLESLSKDKDASYKDMLKAASGLLPEGKVKQFASGLTSFDAGIINQYTSSYTMAGQNLKGLSAGYDLGVVQAGLTVGKTEYVSRDGNVDKYNTWLGKIGFKPAKGHKVELIYYGYSPMVKALEKDQFYQHTDKAANGYKEPVTIISLNYDGQLGKSLLAHMEGASSFKKGQHTALSLDNSALKTSVDYLIPKTTATVKAEWEHLGNAFENNALPYTKAGTERYTLAATTDLFHSFLSVGVQYNYLQQESFSSTGKSTKWGFDIKTHSKRYPSVQLSYKPFSTFRTYSDTLNIPQRPVTGEVWTGRASYQLKRHKNIHRFTLVYNQNKSTADTIRYSSQMLQAAYIYNKGSDAYSVNTGWQSLPLAVNTDGNYSNTNTWMAGIAVNKSLGKQFSGSISEDVAFAAFGLQRMATAAGLSYRMEKQPLVIRLQVRYTNYKTSETAAHKNIYAGMVGVVWQFKTGMKH